VQRDLVGEHIECASNESGCAVRMAAAAAALDLIQPAAYAEFAVEAFRPRERSHRVRDRIQPVNAWAALSGALVGEEAANTRDLGERARALWQDSDRPGAEEGSRSAEGCLAELAGEGGRGVEPGTEIAADKHTTWRLRRSSRVGYEVPKRRAKLDLVNPG
jgi:hypothetical protein